MKISTQSPANIAFVKYWGRADQKLYIPLNNNISMNISGCITTTTVELRDDLEEDIVEVKFYGKDFEKLGTKEIKQKNLFDQINRIRNME